MNDQPTICVVERARILKYDGPAPEPGEHKQPIEIWEMSHTEPWHLVWKAMFAYEHPTALGSINKFFSRRYRAVRAALGKT